MRKKVITHNSKHYQNTPSTRSVYGGNDKKIRESKVVTVTKKNKTKVKTVGYSAVNYYGKQKKTKTKVITKRK